MQLPVDIKAVIDELTDVETARKAPISVSVYIDEACPADIAAHVRAAFTSDQDTVRLTVAYCDGYVMPHPTDDMAVVVAGASPDISAFIAQIRAVGVPAMVVTTMPEIVAKQAEQAGAGIPEGDLIAPAVEGATANDEPYVLTNEMREEIDVRMGRWIATVCREKRLAFAAAFPFVRRPLADDAILSTSLQNAGIGLMPIILGADMPVMTLNQIKMTLQIAAAYGQPMGKERAKEILAVVGSAFACRTLARELVGFIPVLGFVIRPGIGYAATAALGFAVMEYFEGGERSEEE